MSFEIKVLKQIGKVPAGTYAARYLDSKEYGFLQMLNTCKEAQIIEGPQSGEILPYNSYIELGELPAQADVLEQNEKLITDMAEAGKRISEYARKTGALQEKVEILERGKLDLGNRIDFLEIRNRELNGLLDEANHSNSVLAEELEAEFNSKKVELPQKVVDALDWSFNIEGSDWPGIVNDSFEIQVDPRKQAITNYAADNFPDFLRALVNGYTAEPAPEKEYDPELRREINQVISDWWEGRKGDVGISLEGLSTAILNCIKQRDKLSL